MRLTEIKLTGFKSFADNTIFPVDAAVTGIIGPNGCGKSNIIDAVRWVLGESSAKNLRGQNLSDVIFGGSKSRKSGGMASVELHFDNPDGLADGPFGSYKEIVLQRKVTNDGESHYFINKQKCRRKDVVELLQGTGVGARSYAVIEQGMVGRIVEAKPDELRNFLEEAAGIGVYKTRRKESSTKTQEVRELLNRHDDRLQQLGKIKAKLEQESETALIYREYQAEYNSLSHRLLCWQIYSLNKKLADSDLLFKNEEESLKRICVEIAQIGKEQKNLQTELEQAEKIAKNSAEKFKNLTDKLREKETVLIRKKDRAEHLHNLILDADQRVKRYESQTQEDERQILQWREELNYLEEEFSQYLSNQDEANEHLENAQINLHQAQANLQSASQASQQKQQRLNRAQNLNNETEKRLAQIKQRIIEAESEIQQNQANKAPEPSNIEEEIEILNLELENLQESGDELLEKKTQLEPIVLEIKSNLALTEEELKKAENQKEILIDFLPKHADISEKIPENAVFAYQKIEIDKNWQAAVSSYLDRKLRSVCVNKFESIEFSQILSSNEQNKLSEDWQEIIKTELSISIFFNHIKPLFKHDKEIDNLAELIKNKQSFLTLDGSEIGNGVFIIANKNTETTNLPEKLAQLKKIEEEIPALLNKQNQLKEKYSLQKQELNDLNAKIESNKNKQIETEKKLQEFKYKLQINQEKNAHQKSLLAKQQEILEKLLQDRNELSASLANMQDELNLAKSDLFDENKLKLLEENVENKKSEYLKYKEKFEQIKTETKDKENQIRELQSKIFSQNSAQTRLVQEIDQYKQQIKELQIQLEELNLEIENDIQEKDIETDNLTSLNYENEDAQSNLIKLKKNHQNLYEQFLQLESDKKLIEEKINHRSEYLEKLKQELSLKNEEIESDNREIISFAKDEILDETKTNKRLRELKQAMENLGAVNLAAVEELKNIQNEYYQLDTQCKDLHNSLSMLEQAIEQLDTETRKRLKETFTAVDKNFAIFFPILFRGGEANIEWEEGDILEAGLKINVRPPGKKVKNLSVLSGGEKALTAVALVFAFFKLNPAPFCLLDEIDAPLDDANVGRLCDLLREMSNATQFVVITHHKKTMQSCDRLIGVTMSEPGVSRLVSVKFNPS